MADTALPKEEIKIIGQTISDNLGNAIDYHELRTRKTGSFREVDFHLEVPARMTVQEPPEWCDFIE